MKSDDATVFLESIAETLNGEELSLIDFDRLRERLTELASRLAVGEQERADLELLRGESEARIAGMIKAMAAVDPKRGGLETALDEIERLPHMSAAELLEFGRRVAARFRDSFPASFGWLSRAAGSGGRAGRYGDFK